MAISTDSLFIKQASILEVIQENRLINFDTLKRQFLGINERTLRYHLKKLADLGFIKKRGTTRGVYYEAIASQVDGLQG
jgi:predicted transcriptional regulator